MYTTAMRRPATNDPFEDAAEAGAAERRAGRSDFVGRADSDTGTGGRSTRTASPGLGRTIAVAAVVSLLVGGAAGFGGVALYHYVQPPRDARVAPLGEQVAALDSRLGELRQTLRTTQQDLAQTIDSDARLSERVDAQQSRLADVAARVEERFERLKVARGVGSPVFAVATAQLRQAFDRGVPFEAELVNVYALAGDDPRTSRYVHQLAKTSRVGVASADELRGQLRALAAEAGLQTRDEEKTYYDYTVSLLSHYTGLSVQSYEFDHARRVLARADALLAEGQVTAARLEMESLAPQLADSFAPWFESVDHRLTAQRAVDGLSGVVVDTLGVAMKDLPAE